jgi:hypothetical protein
MASATTTIPTSPTSPTSADADPAIEGPSLAVAGRFIDGLAARDFDLLGGTLDPEVGFRALLPRRFVEIQGTEAVLGMFVRWFGNAERFEMVEAVVGEVGGRVHMRWRVRLTDPAIGEGTFVVEQQLYADAATDGRLHDVALLCTGYRPEPS